MASDGNWYAPELHPDYVPPDPYASTPPPDDTSDDVFAFDRAAFMQTSEVPAVAAQELSTDFGSQSKRSHFRGVAVLVVLAVVVAAIAIYNIHTHKHSATSSHITVQSCQSMTQLVEHPPAHPPSVSFYAPATGATTPQAAIKDETVATAKGGLLAACPYVTSQFVWDSAYTIGATHQGQSGYKKATTKRIAAEEQVLLHGTRSASANKSVAKIKDLKCTATQCIVNVTSAAQSSDASLSFTTSYLIKKYNGKWYVSAF